MRLKTIQCQTRKLTFRTVDSDKGKFNFDKKLTQNKITNKNKNKPKLNKIKINPKQGIEINK